MWIWYTYFEKLILFFILEENCDLIVFIIFQLNLIADSVIKHSLMKSL